MLVGNAHNIGISSSEADRSYTIMSADFDHDNEPDYSYILRYNSRNETHPVRVDFVNILGLGMAQKSAESTGSYNFGIMIPKGWFESTNTSLFRFTQFEYEHKDHPTTSPIIMQGGVIEQWVSNNQKGTSNNIPYIHVGGNVWFKEFHTGCHQDKQIKTKHSPISVTGGDYDEFYLTGLYRGDVDSYEDNAECYINGGQFGVLAGAAQEGIGKANGADNTGNITWQIQHADIEEFYGGGFNAAKPVTGNIATTITDSHVTIFCGGPKFGDMSPNKTVITKATDCTFGTYFGAGYGGNSYIRQAPKNHNNIINFPHNDAQGAGNHSSWNNWLEAYYKQDYNAEYSGVSTQFNYQFLPMSSNTDNVARIFVEYVKFSLATTHNVTSTLTGCTVTGNFYGGGSLGKVDGDVTSTLNGCIVKGNVFGAGFSASLPTVEVDAIGFETEPYYYTQTGTYRTGVKYKENNDYKPTTYTWAKKTGNSWIDKTNHILYTNEDLTSLGAVTGLVTLTIDGTTVVGDDQDENSGNVYGGGESSDATGNVNVHILDGTMTDVYGGGKGEKTVVGGDVIVNIGAKSGEGTLSGDGTVNGNVYGGSALGVVNAISTKDGSGNITAYTPTENKTVNVNIYGGAVNGSVFGGGLGNDDTEDDSKDVIAKNFGNTTINMEGGTVSTAVYGGANVNGVLKNDATVKITGGTVGTEPGEGESIANAVFGGGYGKPTFVNGNVTVNIGREKTGDETEHFGNATINGHVYGGGALGCVNASKSGSDPMEFYNEDNNWETKVNLYRGTIKGDAYGGGLGDAVTPAYVGGDVYLLLDGAIVQQIFGCNNLNGTPKGHVKVHVKQTVNIDSKKDDLKNDGTTPRESRTTYDVAAVYGGGNQADYVPADADNGFAEVLIEGCEKTSINHVYGGGNAAAVPATKVTVLGTYIINTLYGGGNGSDPDKPGANVGIIDVEEYEVDHTKGTYGTGKAETKLYGGYINYVYGGSNTKGDVRGGTSVSTKGKNEGTPAGDCCTTLNVGKIYGAGSQADVNSDVNIILECMPEDYVDAVYGGAEMATVNGNVELTVTSGKFGRVFGGNNKGGDIRGTIKVNVYEDGCEPLIIGELYGGGNEAPYSIYGCSPGAKTEDPWTAKVSGTPYFENDTENRVDVEVNVLACTSIGKVFGGGRGSTATVIGNTHVWINMLNGIIKGTPKQKGDDNYIGKIGQVFGGGSAANVIGNTTIDIGTATVYTDENDVNKTLIGVNIINGNDYLSPTSNANETITDAGIYGGGFSADVDGNATLNIGTKELSEGTNITGNIFGGGYGETTHVTGNVTVNIGADTGTAPAHNYVGYANITGDVYGGSAKGTVNLKTDNSSVNTYSYTNPENEEETLTADCYTQVNLYGGTISGNLYGGGLGEDNEAPIADHPADVYGPVTVNVEGGKVTKVFGCNNVLGSPKQTAAVNIHGMEAPEEPATYTITSVYGGGNLAAYNGTGGVSVTMTNGYVNDVFGGGLGTTAVVNGNTTVAVSGGTITNNIYGGGSEAQVTGGTSLTLSGGTVANDVYGGGQEADVTGAVTVAINGGTVAHDVYGGGALANTNTDNWVTDHLAYTAEEVTGLTDGTSLVDGYFTRSGSAEPYTYTPAAGKAQEETTYYRILKATSVTMTGGTIEGNLYGGGLGRLASAGPPAVEAIAANVYSPVLVKKSGGLATNVFGCNNINGAPQTAATIVISGGTIANSVYGGGNVAAFTGNTNVTVSNGTAGYIYGGGLGSTAIVTGDTRVSISGGTINQDVYGGGSQANVTGNVNVSVSGGEVKHDVYGGGALANTNTANTEEAAGNNSDYCFEVLNLKYVQDLPSGDPETNASSVVGYYEDSAGKNLTEDERAQKGKSYYKKINLSEKAYNDATIGTTKKTNVNLTGGVIGNAYGGGLGKLGTDGEPEGPGYVKAMVYGDVSVTVNGAAFTQEVESSAKNAPVTGRVFGCNNINGTPKGSVTVTVNSTRRIDGGAHVLKQFEVQGVYGGGNLADYDPTTFDVATEFGQRTRVIIDGCDATSISKVYGGGNAARVPYTDVTINGAFEIGYVFGGGNGGDMIYKNSAWIDNPGAHVTGYTNVLLKGGTIGQAFGGSDSRGSVGGSNVIQSSGGSCALHLVNLYGAGNGEDANSDGDVTIRVSSCGDYSEIQNVYGGSYKANIKGSVTLTITSGIFTSVYGGNDRMGSIGGNITVNIEETDNCDKPIIIQNLFGGCYQTEYPGAGAQTYKGGDKTDPDNYVNFDRGKITVNVKAATRIDRIFGGSDEGLVNGDTEVNINMVKGSMNNHNAVLPSYYANPGAVLPSNISNITSNEWVVVTGLTVNETSVVGYYTRSGESEPYTYTIVDNTVNEGKAQSDVTYYKQAVKGDIAKTIGTIGEVYGGGNIGNVNGHTTVNIGTETKAVFITEPTHLGTKGTDYTERADGKFEATVEGAHITGDVYGGCYAATVRDNATVNICAKYDEEDSKYDAVDEGAEGVTITGSVFGGGKGIADSFTCAKGMVGDETNDGNDGTKNTGKGTHVRIGHGTIAKNVFGGGETGRVEWDTEVTIGYGNGTGGAKTPVIQGSVFGGGQGVKTHGYSALVRGNSSVTVQGDAKVEKNIYGGSEVATVGKYWVYTDPLPDGAPPVPDGVSFGMPYATRTGGECTVTVKDYVQVGPDDAANVSDDAGHVYGGGMGVKPNYKYDPTNASTLANSSKRMVAYNSEKYKPSGLHNTWDYYEADHNFIWEYFPEESDYLKYLETLALVSDTYVTIDGHATVKGNVYGGSQNGFLQRDTEVEIKNTNVTIGTTGTTKYGNVFGGGKGVLGFDKAGRVRGDTKLTISGGTMHGSVYGGGELGFVGKFSYDKDTKTYSWQTIKDKNNEDKTPGKCTVAISGTTTIKGHVYGAGKGSDDTFECEQAMVRTTSVTINAGTVEKNVYGGGEVGRVDQNAVVTLGVANASGDAAPDIKGNVFGAGQGIETHGYSGLARGNTTVTVQGTTKVGKSVYGGGEIAAVGRYGLDSSGMPSTLVSGGECTVTIKDNALIGYDGGGNVYGASKGVDESQKTYTYVDNEHRPKRMMSYSSALYNDANSAIWEYTASDEKYVWEYFDTREKYLNFLQTLALVTDTYLTIDENTVVHGSAYGGSESGFVQRDTEVEIKGSSHIGTTSPVLIGHVFGGGKGVSGFDKAGRVRGNTKVAIDGSAAITGNVYGGGELGFVGKFECPDGRTYNWQKIRGKEDEAGTTNYETGSCIVNITGGTIGYDEDETVNHASGHVFGAGKGEALTFKCEPAMVRKTSVSVTNGTVYGNVYGGGEIARVDQDIEVAIGSGAGSSGGAAAPAIKGNVFGAGAGVETHGYSALVRGNTTVTVAGNANVGYSVYGGGEIASVGKYGLDSAGLPSVLQGGGECTVTIKGYAKIGPDNGGHVFGASKGVDESLKTYTYTSGNTGTMPKRMMIYSESSYNENSENPWERIAGTDFVWEYYDTRDKYLNYLQTLALATDTKLTIDENTSVNGSVYGGSENGFVQRNSDVEIKGSCTIASDVYGGGKGLATFSEAGQVSGDVTLTVTSGTMSGSVYGGGEMGIVKKSVTVNINGGSISNNVYGGGALADTNTDNWDTSANNGAGGWAEGKTSASNTTTVNLKGGTISHDAYGGALGQESPLIEPKVYGDILVELNKDVAIAAQSGDYKKGCIVEKIFGCNDMKGTPKGHVKVHVYATQHKNKGATIAAADKYAKYRKLSDYIDSYSTYVSELDAFATTFSADISSYKTDLADTYWQGQSGSTDDEKKANLLKKRNRALDNIRDALAAKYDVLAVYGGGDLAAYEPANDNEKTEVIIDGCELTSIKQVYGSGNAASTPACDVTVYGTYEIDELFGGGNGKDNFQLNGKWYENPGANVGYKNYTHYVTTASTEEGYATYGKGDADKPYKAIENRSADGYPDASTKEYRQANYSYGTGRASTDVIGGRIHNVYGGSNMKGNIRTTALSVYETSTECTLTVDNSYGAGKDALIDGEARVSLECVDYMANLFGGSTNADVNSDVTLTVTNGIFGKVFGGNNTSGKIFGSITVNIKESGCKPIIIDELYGGGYLAGYSIYGYYNAGTEDAPDWKPRTKAQFETAKTEALEELGSTPTEQQKTDKLIEKGLYGFPKDDPRINVISATKIGEIYGGGYKAIVVGSPHINVNMENGMVPAKYAKDNADFTASSTPHVKTATDGTNTHEYQYVVDHIDAGNNAILALGTIGYIFGGGNEADIIGNTYVDIGTGEWLNWETKTTETISRKAAQLSGSVYGGGRMGHVGDFTKTNGKPTSCAEGTGICTVTISNGEIGPNDMKMLHTPALTEEKPDDAGHVFGAGQGTNLPADDNAAYVDSVEVVINGTAWVKGSVFGGGENGHVLHNAGVKIGGNCQIGNGHLLIKEGGSTIIDRGLNRRFTDTEWTNGHLTVTDADFTTEELAATSGLVDKVNTYFANSLPECASWPYEAPYAPHDKFAKYKDDATGKTYYNEGKTQDALGGYESASDGHTFYGNVFGGGSGYFPYAAGQWNHKAGWIEGNSWVEITGGHILTSVYGGGELANVGNNTLTGDQGRCTVVMSGGTLGVPRTIDQISAHPVTCYLFGAGKGDQITAFNTETNIKEAVIEISGDARIYGSVFGGGEDGHVLGDVKMSILPGSTKTVGGKEIQYPYIGTWGTSYVEGNVFGGGRGFSGGAYTPGNVGGSVDLDIKGGTMLGSIYGGGRLASVGYGLYAPENANYGVMRDDDKDDAGSTTTYYKTTGLNKKGRGYIDVNISGGTIGNDAEFEYAPDAATIGSTGTLRYTVFEDYTNSIKAEHDSEKDIMTMEYETDSKGNPTTTIKKENIKKVKHTKGGNVFAGGMGRRMEIDGVTPMSESWWPKLGNAKSTKLTISGGTIKSNVYGGGEMGSLTGYHTTKDSEGNDVNVSTEVIITGGTIGTEVKKTFGEGASATDVTQYTFGSVYGGGMGLLYDDSGWKLNGGNVESNTSVSISGADTRVWASVFGGGEFGITKGNSYVDINGGKIGKSTLRDDGFVLFGSSYMGNVYGSGEGSVNHVEAGLVKGNTNVNITGGNIYHMVYGGGALASVGTFDVSQRVNGVMQPPYMPVEGIPYQWRYTNGDVINPAVAQGDRTPTGTATVNITGGTIGISGRDNGLVFGGSRGDISDPNVYFTEEEITAAAGKPTDPAYGKTTSDIKDSGFDPYLKVAWVNKAVVNIGLEDSGTDYTKPLIKGSVYGGGENGHNYSNATVNINSGTIGITDKIPGTNTDDPWWNYGDEDVKKKHRASRGNVYGAGSGSDTYTDRKGNEHYNPKTGMVGGNTVVNIKGGHIGRSVYGAGAMASVGNITNARDTIEGGSAKHKDIIINAGKEVIRGFGLSWPYKFDFATNTGKTTVNVTGGHIGTKDVDGGDVFGGARGEAGDRYTTAHLALVNETEVNINYPSTPAASDIPNIYDDFSIPCVTGSVSGSGEDGYVYGDTHVTLNEGLVGHSLYGGGKGKGTYTVTLNKIVESGTYKADIYSLIAGKVFGNTYVTMNGGYVGRNVYGGGNMASVGKGNYAGGVDDYFPNGYGETLYRGVNDPENENLWTSESGFKPDEPISELNKPTTWADYFMSSGKTTVKVFGGTVGYVDADPKNSIKNNLPYGNVFGGSAGEAAPNVPQNLSPRYHYCPAFFSGYVNETDVNIGGYECISTFTHSKKTYKVGDRMTLGELQTALAGSSYLVNGKPNPTYWTTVGPTRIYGSVYGGGQDGHVRRDTHVTVVAGEIGVPYDVDGDKTYYNMLKTADLDDDQWLHRGNVYGAGSGISEYEFDFNNDGDKVDEGVTGGNLGTGSYNEKGNSTSAGSVTRFTQVDIYGGTIHRNVYGGGSLASIGPLKISQDYDPYKPGQANIPGKTPNGLGQQSLCTVNIAGQVGTPSDYRVVYGGEVYGASRGKSNLDANQFATTFWTLVRVLNGATIMGNVYGGGDNGMVKMDTDVRIGE